MSVSLPCLNYNNKVVDLRTLHDTSNPDSVGCLGDVVNAGGGEGVNGNGVIGGDNIAVSFADGRSLLSVSCVQGSLDLVQWVLNSEYDEGSRDFCGWTPMHVAGKNLLIACNNRDHARSQSSQNPVCSLKMFTYSVAIICYNHDL